MPGASGIKGTNWLYHVAPKDGSVFGGTYNNLVIEPLLGDKATQFDPRKFEWIGAMGKQYLTCAVWHTSDIKTIEDAKTRTVRVGTTGATGNSSLFPKMLNRLLGTKFEVIAGYTTPGLRIAQEQGEVEGICGFSYDTFSASSPEWIRDGKIRFFLQSGEVPIKQLPDVPRLSQYVKDPKDLAALKVFDVRDSLGRPHMFPPGTPKDRVAALRTAFDATMKDAKFLDEAEKLHIEIDPMTGADMEKRILEAYAAPKDVIARAVDLWPPALQKEKE
jgi:tripartite-type tricarboxylate transporter receptor subunit TctC